MEEPLSPLKFVFPGHEKSDGEFSAETRLEITSIRKNHPELEHWGDLAIAGAWGDYSQQALEVSWCYWLVGERDDDFISFIINE